MAQFDSSKSAELHDMIARISLNWGTVENFAGAILADIYGLVGEAASDLVHVIDLRKKIDLIVKGHRSGKIPQDAVEYVKALEYCNKHYRKNRNIVAHGLFDLVGEANEVGLRSFHREQSLSLSDLGIVLEQSRYAVDAIMGVLSHHCGNGKPEPLPPKPTELPVR